MKKRKPMLIIIITIALIMYVVVDSALAYFGKEPLISNYSRFNSLLLTAIVVELFLREEKD